ncbi:MAG: cytochrome c3 family protein, partial [candidate division Zixibacteria bacterium]
IGFVWYFFSPEFTDVGYKPDQPVEYSHKLHAGDLGLDCRYCHVGVERSAVAGVPPTQTCMNCHKIIKADSEKLLTVRQSWDTGIPIEWIRVHKVPDYAYFNHSAHLRADIGCASCHGNVAEMDVVRQVEPLSMSWCLDCHRNPDMHIRTEGDVTSMKWTPSENQLAIVANIKEEKKIDPPTDCSGCHR